jgi:CheY-like chemotaxis protein
MSPEDIHILIVEDDEDDAALTLRALGDMALGRRALRVRDGEEALEVLFATGRHAGRGAASPRLILLDMSMPKMDGLQVLAAVKGDPRTKAIPVVMLTSSGREEDVARSYALGVNSYIVKPASFDEYAAAVVGAGSYWLTWNKPA